MTCFDSMLGSFVEHKYLENKGVKKRSLSGPSLRLLDKKTKVTKREVQDWGSRNSLEVNEVWEGIK